MQVHYFLFAVAAAH
ncbi:hypothetical protein CO2235_150261 [Cupriavidus oxalaticus]|nr:hypothetical protein CO2235_150261 [Cupriavidus oxalaticus]